MPLGQALGRQQAVVQHMRALPHGAVADALATVRASQASVTTKDAFEFLVRTAARSGEMRLTTWDEMDLDAGVWTIPGARMKAKRDHRVPLSGRALAILHDVRRLSNGTGLPCAQLAISVNNCPPPRDPRSRMTSFKRTQRKYVQKAYRVRNWREYETGLRARGSLTVWLGLTDGKLANWNSPRPTRRKPGRQRKYSNHAIETTVTLGLVFGLASRQTEGFLRSLLTLLNLDNDVPDHSTISRRKARLGKVASYERRTVKPVHLRIDSSGLSVHVGQLRTPPKARDYRKLHLAVDEHTSDVVACELTSKRARDASRVASLVGQIERPIASAKADAAYDTGDVYKTLENHRAHRSPKVLIPPRKGAQLALDSAGTRQRNRNIRARSRVGKRKWYVASGYSRRSKVRRRSTATRPTWAQRCERGDWRPRESR